MNEADNRNIGGALSLNRIIIILSLRHLPRLTGSELMGTVQHSHFKPPDSYYME